MSVYLEMLKNIIAQINASSYKFLFWIIIFSFLAIIVSALINFFLSRSVLGFKYRYFVGFGVIIHELSHVLFCLLTGARIKKISLFDKEGGSVEHAPSRLPFLGPVLISLAPFFIGIFMIILLSSSLGLKMEVFDSGLIFSFKGFLHQASLTLGQFDLNNFKNWLILYLMLSIVVTMTPSRQDLKNVFLILITIAGAIYFIARYSTFSFDLSFIPYESLLVFLVLAMILLILLLILSMIIWIASKVFIK